MENSKNQNQIELSLNKTTEKIEKVYRTLNSMNNIAALIQNTATIMKNIKEINYEIKKLDAQLTVFITTQQTNLAKFQTKAKLIEKQLDALNNRIDKLLDKILEIDINTTNPEVIKFRGEMIAQIREWSDSINAQIFKLL